MKKSELNWYVEKFLMKMNGSTIIVAREWAYGIGQPAAFCEKLWQTIKAHPKTHFTR